MTAEYEIQPLSWIVKPKGATIFDETATIIERVDEASGQFLKVVQHHDHIKPGEIQFGIEEWPKIRAAIQIAFDQILADELHEFAPKGKI
jgi:hypothetical protein